MHSLNKTGMSIILPAICSSAHSLGRTRNDYAWAFISSVGNGNITNDSCAKTQIYFDYKLIVSSTQYISQFALRQLVNVCALIKLAYLHQFVITWTHFLDEPVVTSERTSAELFLKFTKLRFQ